MAEREASEKKQADENEEGRSEYTSIEKSIDSIIKREGYLRHSVEMKCLSRSGLLGVLYAVDITGTTADGEKETNLFVKRKIATERLETLFVADAYAKEIYAYQELSKIMEELQDEANIPHEEKYKMARCYAESSIEAIILENLEKRNFKTMLNPFHLIELEFAKLSIQHLAKFHAISMAVEFKRPSYFENVIKPMKYLLTFDERMDKYCKNVQAHIVKNLDLSLRSKVEEKYKNGVMERFQMFSENSSCLRCLCHGDYKPDNIMLREQNGKVVELLTVDYQFLYYSSPIHDFARLIFTSTDQEFRRKHLEYLKNFYYESLGRFLKYFELVIDSVYPRDKFDMDYKQQLEFELINSILSLMFLLAPSGSLKPENIKNMTSDDYDEYRRKRINEVIEDFANWGYL